MINNKINGLTIKINRLKKNLTLSQAAKGICSISYLSKIENGSLDPQSDIEQLMFMRLEIPNEEAKQLPSIEELSYQLTKGYREILLDNKIGVIEAYNEIRQNYTDLILHPNINFKYVLFELRYYLLIHDLPSAYENLNYLNQFSNHLSTQEIYFYTYCKGILFSMKKDYNIGLKYLLEAQNLQEQLDLNNDRISYHVSLTYSHLNKPLLAIENGRKAIKSLECIELTSNERNIRLILAINYGKLKMFSHALIEYEIVLERVLEVGTKKDVAMIYYNIALLYVKSNDSDQSIIYFLKSLNYRSKEDPYYFSTKRLLAREYFTLMKYNKALFLIEEAYQLVDKTQNIEEYFKIKLLRYQIINRDKYNKEAISFLEKKVLPFFIKHERGDLIVEYSELLSEYFSRKQQYKKAHMYIQQAFVYKNNLLRGDN
ncbi:hypothetical protein [Guptibacillus hwajinpoensis]|uniref:Tetratricopeptide (TPR) repeat protein n=1 Tax=Guptibacillus hwajinpoensis TaxID=208199 RepID=A0ABU0JZD7_9BACL|nr:hypothetical protein [Alkalihalobacillus hemicentroti]MDQ0482477.1 tetratricopeptide (TPR) repeat protein [Alkalihalobacillus hemicentroti]